MTAVYSVQDVVSGQLGYEETPLSVGAAQGYATPLYAADPQGTTTTINETTSAGAAEQAQGATNANLSHFILTWPSGPTGVQIEADDWVVDFSESPTFTTKYTYHETGNVFAPNISTTGLNLKTSLPGYVAGNPIFFRVGSRHSADTPGPFANQNYIPNPDANGKGGSYLYASDTGYFSGT